MLSPAIAVALRGKQRDKTYSSPANAPDTSSLTPPTQLTSLMMVLGSLSWILLTGLPALTAMDELDKWQITAVHESGHIAGYLRFNWRFGRVRIWETDDGEVKGSVNSPAGKYDPFPRAICCMAGPVAEEVLTGVPLEEQTSYRDINMAREALARIELADRFDERSVIPFTKLLVEYNWPVICALAHHRPI